MREQRRDGATWIKFIATGGVLTPHAVPGLAELTLEELTAGFVIRLWNPVSGAHLHTLTGHSRRVWSVEFSQTGELLASGSDDGTVRLWSVATDPPRSG